MRNQEHTHIASAHDHSRPSLHAHSVAIDAAAAAGGFKAPSSVFEELADTVARAGRRLIEAGRGRRPGPSPVDLARAGALHQSVVPVAPSGYMFHDVNESLETDGPELECDFNAPHDPHTHTNWSTASPLFDRCRGIASPAQLARAGRT